MLVKINLIKEQPNSCPPFYPEEHALGINGKLAFASPHVSDTIRLRTFTFCFDFRVLLVNPSIPNHKSWCASRTSGIFHQEISQLLLPKVKKNVFLKGKVIFFLPSYLLSTLSWWADVLTFHYHKLNCWRICSQFFLPSGYNSTFRMGCL